ncbi:hypothetical protein [Streptomyces sp. FH025]|uniref:hypothetical protein n=1 Tax=Streptomyces sp. FH025 TaxID=2815937 RepID=UPI001A9E2A32|nr:hypothetical protein [Streptomyces sp. FH025]MBO1417510.1 hypothetical protein [Streptomyces sp. FH025]
MNRLKRAVAAATAVAAAALIPLTAAPAGAATGPATHLGMTWTVLATGPEGTVQVGVGTSGNAYSGDTAPSVSLPVLCLKVDGSPAPAGISLSYYTGWAQGTVALSQPVLGARLNSRAAADSVCQASFGSGWREAEFRDGRYGPDLSQTGCWTFWAYGNIPNSTRFWTAINDQPANPWD